MPDHASDLQDALTVMERAGIQAYCVQTANGWTATAADGTSHVWRVTAASPRQAVVGIMEAMGFEDLD